MGSCLDNQRNKRKLTQERKEININNNNNEMMIITLDQ